MVRIKIFSYCLVRGRIVRKKNVRKNAWLSKKKFSGIEYKIKKTWQPHFVVVECEFVYICIGRLFFHFVVSSSSSWLFPPNTHTHTHTRASQLTTLKFNFTSNRKKEHVTVLFLYPLRLPVNYWPCLQRKVPSIRFGIYMTTEIWFTRFSLELRPSCNRHGNRERNKRNELKKHTHTETFHSIEVSLHRK